MSVILPVTSGGMTVAGAVVAASTGWTTPEGLSAFLVSLTGLAALCWSIYSYRQRQKGLDEEQAREIAKVIREELRRDET